MFPLASCDSVVAMPPTVARVSRSGLPVVPYVYAVTSRSPVTDDVFEVRLPRSS